MLNTLDSICSRIESDYIPLGNRLCPPEEEGSKNQLALNLKEVKDLPDKTIHSLFEAKKRNASIAKSYQTSIEEFRKQFEENMKSIEEAQCYNRSILATINKMLQDQRKAYEAIEQLDEEIEALINPISRQADQ